MAGNGAVEYLHVDAGCQSRLTRLQGPERGTPRCLQSDAAAGSNGLSVAPGGEAIYVSLALADGTDIGVMPVAADPPPLPLGTLKWLPVLGKPDS